MKIYKENERNAFAQALADGKILAFPTDTVFGVGVLYGDLSRLDALKNCKHRPESKPIPLMAATLEQIEQAAELNERAKKLANALFPGPVTLILPKKDSVPDAYTNGMQTIAVRIPDAPVLLEILALLPAPLFVSSANLSGEPAALTVQDVLDSGLKIDGVLEGLVQEGQASTIIDCTGEKISILRPGPVSMEQIEKVFHT